MATKKQTLSGCHDRLMLQLFSIRSVVGLCGFAAEARRTLDAIERATATDPSFEATLSRLVDSRHEWSQHGDHLGDVLKDIDSQLEGVIELAADLED